MHVDDCGKLAGNALLCFRQGAADRVGDNDAAGLADLLGDQGLVDLATVLGP